MLPSAVGMTFSMSHACHHCDCADTFKRLYNVMAYLLLLLTAFVAATIFPIQSEALLTGLVLTGKYPVWALVTVASIGNIAGSTVNWFLGRTLDRYKTKRWFPVKEKHLHQAERYYKRYGRWSLLLSWVPIIGDPITVMSGVLGERLRVFLLLVGIAKTGRYLAVLWIVLHGLWIK